MEYKGIYKVLENINIANNVYKMILEGNTEAIKRPGQFINIKLKDERTYLRRPISICDYDSNTITIIYKVVGIGTNIMKELKVNDTVDCLIGLGNGYDTNNLPSKDILLVGGGVGTPPLYALAKKLKQEGNNITTILGFRTKDDVFYEEEFKEFGEVFVSTMNGEYGHDGVATDLLGKVKFDYYFACGANLMLESLVREAKGIEGQLSFEERMGCGFGACMGCSCKTKGDNYKRICVEGPVLLSSEVIFND